MLTKTNNFDPAISSASKPSILVKRKTKVVQCFLDANLTCMVEGFLKILGKHDIKVEKYEKGHLIPFVNRARNYIKVVACNGTRHPVIGAYRLPRGRIYDLRVLGEIPSAFRADGAIDFDSAIKEVLDKYFQKKTKGQAHLDIVNRARKKK